MSRTKWSQNDALFAQECAKGYGWQMFVAGYLSAQGLRVQVPPLRIRGHVRDRKQFKDGGDLVVEGHVLECKARNIHFTCRQDLPYTELFVDTVHNWREKEVKPVAYVCISTQTQAMIVTPGKNPRKWGVTKTRDQVRGVNDAWYTAHRSRWWDIVELVKHLKGK